MNEKMKLLTSWEPLDLGAPETIKEQREKNGGKIILKGIFQRADAVNQNGRIYPREILEREVRNYQKFIIENRALGECVPPGTEIYTRDGWKNIENIAEDEFIYTLNVSSNELEIQRINSKVVLPFDGELLRFRNASSYDMCLTPSHRVLMWNRKHEAVTMTAAELYDAYHRNDSAVSHSYLKFAQADWKGEETEKFMFSDGTCIDTQLWAAFLGIYLAEGHSSGVYKVENQKDFCVTITQNSGEIADQIRLLLKKLPWEFIERVSHEGRRCDFTIKNRVLHSHLFPLGGSRTKYAPAYVKTWSCDLLQTFLDWALMGDGRHRAYHKGEFIPEYCTTSPQLAVDVADVMFKLGYGSNTYVYEPNDKPAPDFDETGRMILAENQVPMHIVHQRNNRSMSLDLRFMSVEKIKYKGDVYCVNVKNGTWLMRYNGRVCWTHNCDHPDSSVVNLKNVSHVIRELKMQDDVCFGAMELLDTPSGKILQTLVESGVKLGISSRGVGSTSQRDGITYVEDDYCLVTFDAVVDPSCPGAFLHENKKLIGDLKKILNKSDRIDRTLNDIISMKVTK